VSELVRFERVTCRYGSEPVLVNVDLSVSEGDFVGVVGPSGSGKTTLLRAIAGAVRPIAGRIVRDRSATVGYVPQVETVNWYFPVTVREAVLMSISRVARRPSPAKSSSMKSSSPCPTAGAPGVAVSGAERIRAHSGRLIPGGGTNAPAIASAALTPSGGPAAGRRSSPAAARPIVNACGTVTAAVSKEQAGGAPCAGTAPGTLSRRATASGGRRAECLRRFERMGRASAMPGSSTNRGRLRKDPSIRHAHDAVRHAGRRGRAADRSDPMKRLCRWVRRR